MSTLSFDPNAAAILLDAEIEAKIILHATVVLDTGASFVVLPWRIITGLGIRINPAKLVSTTTPTTVESAPVVTIPQITILGETVRNVACLVKDLPPKSGVDGLLGLSFLRHFNLNVDFVKGKLTLKR